MKSGIAEHLNCTHEPVAILFAEKKPEKTRQFQEGKWGCVMFMLAAAAKGDAAVFDKKTFGCQSIGIYPFRENKRPEPRAVLGINDISARVYIKRILKDDLMSFAIPVPLFHEMEDNLTGSFLEQDSWQQLVAMSANKSLAGSLY